METIEALGKYEIKRPLGRGAMGTVYEGWDPIIARRVAIKTVKLPDSADPETEEALARFRREAQAAGRLTHPNIVAVFDYGETSDLAYIVMEFVEGPPLKTLLDRHEHFALADTVRVMQDLLAGLQFSHERGVVHRDIKPANVMLTSAGQAKIADFGIARIDSSSMTQAGTLLGTPAYMSPEQFMGQVVDARTDIYSSGVLLYQMLTGERPFEGSMSAIMHKVLNTEPPVPSLLSVTAPPSFDAVVRRAMSRRPEDRFPSAGAFAEAMRVALANQAEPAVREDEATLVAAPPPQPAARTALDRRPTRRRTSLPIIVARRGAHAYRSSPPRCCCSALSVVVPGGSLRTSPCTDTTGDRERHSDATTSRRRRSRQSVPAFRRRSRRLHRCCAAGASATRHGRPGCAPRPGRPLGEQPNLRDPGRRGGRQRVGDGQWPGGQRIRRGPPAGPDVVRSPGTDRFSRRRRGPCVLSGTDRAASDYTRLRRIGWATPRAADGRQGTPP